MKTPTLILMLFFCTTSLAVPIVGDPKPGCHIEAYVAQVPTDPCQRETYPMVLKPSQPHTQFVQDLVMKILPINKSFTIKKGMTEFSFELKAGYYHFMLSDPSINHCSKTQELEVANDMNQAPIKAVCKDITVQLEDGSTRITGDMLAGESQRYCGSLSYSLSQSDFSCADLGTQLVEVTLSDERKKTATCFSKVKVLPSSDQIPTYNSDGSPGPCFTFCGQKNNGSKAFFKAKTGEVQVMSGLALGKSPAIGSTFISQWRNGDGEISVKVSNITTPTGKAGRAGIMIRESCEENAPYISLSLEEETRDIYKKFRMTAEGIQVEEWEHRVHQPSWLRLKRKGNNFKAFTSFNGKHWKLAFSLSMKAAEGMEWGIVVENHSSASRTLGIFHHLSLSSGNNAPYPVIQDGSTEKILDPFSENSTSRPKAFGIQDQKPQLPDQEQWSIFPNPAQDYLEVTLPIWKDDRATLHLLSSAGNVVLEEKLDDLNGQSHWLNLAAISGGIYYLKLQTIEGQHLTKKVIVKK